VKASRIDFHLIYKYNDYVYDKISSKPGPNNVDIMWIIDGITGDVISTFALRQGLGRTNEMYGDL